MNKIVALIPARGGSKGIPKKNIINLNGYPLIYYTIEASKKTSINEIWVSTDDEEIKNIALNYGAKVIDRPPELSTDKSSSEDALLHFAENVDFDILVFIQNTSPMLKSEDINKGIDKIINEEYDSIISLSIANDLLMWNENIKPINYDLMSRGRRQERKDLYIENGAFYITKRECLLESKCRISGKIGFVQIPYWRSFQIDDYDDLDGISKLMVQNYGEKYGSK